mgnify:CR=1 FL=1
MSLCFHERYASDVGQCFRLASGNPLVHDCPAVGAERFDHTSRIVAHFEIDHSEGWLLWKVAGKTIALPELAGLLAVLDAALQEIDGVIATNERWPLGPQRRKSPFQPASDSPNRDFDLFRKLQHRIAAP